MENKLVRFSRTGDAFHYRWAARRCLKLIYPKSVINSIVIEGSKEVGLAGEYVIDLAEYSQDKISNREQVTYYQLKHTVQRKYNAFQLSDLKDTLTGFSTRYTAYLKDPANKPAILAFVIVTNRNINPNLKESVEIIANGGKVYLKDAKTINKRFYKTFEGYTKLKGKVLKSFCSLLKFTDEEGDYESQYHSLHLEISQFLAGTVDHPQINNIIALVSEKALPNSDGKIVKEEILKRFGVTAERDLFPAIQEFERLNNPIEREQHKALLTLIINSPNPLMIHSGGGVGKTIVALQLSNSLPPGSVGIVYDCFGAGKYRNPSEPRHRHRDGLIQIINELAILDLCAPAIAPSTAHNDSILRMFISCLQASILSLKKLNNKALLAIFIDAADNAEMAAAESNQPSFVNDLLRIPIPDGCRLIVLCRTERISLLKASDLISKFELKPFSKAETYFHIKSHLSDITESDSLEIYRLTNGNPRVQANILNTSSNIKDVLNALGPSGISAEEQIKAQLDSAIAKLKEKYTYAYQEQIDSICSGLATLPPYIPIEVLAKASGVEPAAVSSFVTDLGRPLWVSDSSVQFRDEPTETWFKERYSASKEQIISYISKLEPLASEYAYVSQTLPSLYLLAGKYSELIDSALSDTLLPRNNPIDERNIRVHRLQFAFKAALKLKRYADACKLSLRAGEEVAGDQRQLNLLKNNIDLIAPLLNKQRVQELAFRHLLQGKWSGSENVYSASLLSSVEEFRGEARAYLRASENWLKIYFEERDERIKKDSRDDDDVLTLDEIIELVYTHYNLDDKSKTTKFILSWIPHELVHDITRKFIKRLIDDTKYDDIQELAREGSNNQYMIIAISHEFLDVGRFLDKEILGNCLQSLNNKRLQIPIPDYSYNETYLGSIISFLESCAFKKLPKNDILKALLHYFPSRAPRWISHEYQEKERNPYLRAVALQMVLSNHFDQEIDKMLPNALMEEDKKKVNESEIKEFTELIGGLLPWYILRARVVTNQIMELDVELKNTGIDSKKNLSYKWNDSYFVHIEITHIIFELLMLYRNYGENQIDHIYHQINENSKLPVKTLLKFLRSAYRLDHLSSIREELEQVVYALINSSKNESPETISEWYVDLARSVISTNPDDAMVYFDLAIIAVSKFGDEIVQRWEAVTSLANRSADDGQGSAETAYRFIRCAELVGEYVEEKHWDRNATIITCARISPASSISALSRWRDRDIGWFEGLFYSLINELISSNSLEATIGWSLSFFVENENIFDLLSNCINKESSSLQRNRIFETAIHDFQLKELSNQKWEYLENLAQKYSYKNRILEDILINRKNNPTKIIEEKKNYPIPPITLDKSEVYDWNDLTKDLDVTSSEGIGQAFNKYRNLPNEIRFTKSFWEEIFNQIATNKIIKFLNSLVIVENLNLYELKDAISSIPGIWKRKVSVQHLWPSIIENYSKRFATKLTDKNTLKYISDSIDFDGQLFPFIQNGILRGLSDNSDLSDSNTFFGFVDIVTNKLSATEASELLDYALERFEIHIDDKFGDGKWAEWLKQPDNVNNALCGFIWSALGSPRSEIRWRAAHSVRRLAEFGCKPEIDLLISWMNKDSVESFGSHNFPFYNFHSRLYLLIAFARISLDNPLILRQYSDIFKNHALGPFHHVIIQKFAADIALNIEKGFAGTFNPEILIKLNDINVSKLPPTKARYGEKFQSPWHERNEVDQTLKFLHGYDFDRYWFEPLGNVFGITGKEVEELATEIIIKEWGIKTDGSFKNDPRSHIWRSTRYENETYSSHGDYPKTDDYSFYLSYHAMFVVASKFLHNLPIVYHEGEYDDDWKEWLNRHLLTINDGLWLADRRDPAPLYRPNWIFEKNNSEWRSNILDNDFLDGLFCEQDNKRWLVTAGHWHNRDDAREESYSIATALVSPETSQALLYALNSFENPHDYKLPNYQEEDNEYEMLPFSLKGWLYKSWDGKYLDDDDPFACEIPYPPYKIGDEYIKLLGLSSSSDFRKWYLEDNNEPCLISEIWSTEKKGYEGERLRQGNRLLASLEFIKKMCTISGKDLIIEVEIQRRFNHKSYERPDNNESEYKPPYSKIYIFTKEGKLRDQQTNYEFR